MTQPTGDLLGDSKRPVVVIDRVLSATTHEAWAAWTEPDRLARWFGAVDAPLTKPGRSVRMAMMESVLPERFDDAANPTTLTVRSVEPPTDGGPARLEMTFDDAADGGGTLIVELSPIGKDRCRLVLWHALAPAVTALEQAPGFGAGWEGFLDWLEDVLAERPVGADSCDPLLPFYRRSAVRLQGVEPGRVETDGPCVEHRRRIDATIWRVWDLVATGEGLATWLGSVSDGRPGADQTLLVVHDQDDPETTTQTSTVTIWEPPTRMDMTWDFPGEPTSHLSIRLEAAGESTELILIHRGVGHPDDDYLVGWHAHLDLLTASAEGWGRPTFGAAFRAAQLAHGDGHGREA